ncbi:MAG: hypothetical protein IJW63_09690 [Lachnospiraceae bacterium]|nr:hypothetical protein [Lachnospiraceae bacterium]
MNFNDFITFMLEEVKRELGQDVKVEVREVCKNNGIMLKGLTILSKESNLSPTIYLNGFYKEYQEGKELIDVKQSILEVYRSSKVDVKVDMDFFLDYEKVKNKLFCKLINYDKNTCLLQDVPYQKFLDLAVVCYFAYEAECMGSGFITIHTNHLDNWGIDENELFERAMTNTKSVYPGIYYSMEDMLRQMVEKDVRRDLEQKSNDLEGNEEEWISFTVEQIMKGLLGERKRSPMYVITNEGKAWGATCMLWKETLQKLAEELESDLFILPSSVHEIIIVPADEEQVCVDYLQSMVEDINRTHVEPEEVLSDHIYRYLRDSGTTILQ